MQRSALFALFAVLVLLGALGGFVAFANRPRAVASHSYAYAPPFAHADCPAPAAGVPLDVPLTCGYLSVSENRSVADSRTIEVAVTIVHSPNETVETPVVYLGGGPGGPLLEDILVLMSDPALAELFVAERDWIFIEQRGVGYSRPPLSCPYTADVDPRMAQQCLAAMQAAGVDLTGYNTIETAADVEALRQALGIAQWHVAGHSYGTRWALSVARYYPQSVRSLVLDGVFPPQMTPDRWMRAIPGVIDRLLDQCAADTACRASYPNLKERLRSQITQLNAEPALLKAQPFTGDALADWVFGAAHDPALIKLIPAVIDAFARGDYQFVEQAVPSIQLDLASVQAYKGMYLSVNCYEEMAFSQEADFLTQQALPDSLAAAMGRKFLNEYRICQSWPSGRAPAIENTPVSSAAPTLIFNGEFDPATPMADGYLAAQTLTSATVLDFPGATHVLNTQGTCSLRLMAAFFRTLDGPGLDTSCIAEEFGPPAFTLP